MRLTSGLLLASASSAFGQFTRFTNSSTSAVETATSSTSSVPTTTALLVTTTKFGTTDSLISPSSTETTTTPSASSIVSFALDLRNAVLGPGASFYPPPDGDSILLSPVASDSNLNRRQGRPLPIPIPIPAPIAINTSYASFKASLSRDISSSLGISVNRVVNVTFVSPSGSSRKRAESSPCVFEVFVDGEVALAVPVSGSFRNLKLSTNPVPPKDSYDLVFRQSCNGDNIDIVLEGAAIQNGQGVVSTPIPSIILGTPTGTSETNSAGLSTNSEGETIFPTETTPTASSDAATTRSASDGETVLTTGTATGATSGRFTTNSEGETIFPTNITTGVSSADSSTRSEGDTTGTATSTSTSATATLPAGFPSDVGDFTLFGCVASTAGFPTFTLAQSNPDMDLNMCSTLCTGRPYFGVHYTACYCGDEIVAASRVGLDQCDIECPGNSTQFCGGEISSKLRARQAIPSNILLTVYVATEAGVTLTESVTQTVTGQKTVVTTFTTTTTNTRALSTATEVITATLVCIDGKCHSVNSVTVYTFVEINGSDYNGQWVYISEPCSCAGGQRFIPKFCSAGICGSMKVYKPQQCPDWYNYNIFFVPKDTDCSTCPSGEMIYQPWEESWGTPDNYSNAVPTCSGFNCPSQKNVVRPHQGVNWNATVPHGASDGGSKSSSSNGDSGNFQPGSSSGSNGESTGGSNTSPNGSPNSGKNGGSGSGSQGEPQTSDIPGSEGSHPSTIAVVSRAGTYTFSVISLLAALAALF
ncbi:hypothetical protein FGADI_11414 [Fusarium gaditjirri]|uniref:WSC domain-containing protein n=1 Tax=Fusarium gaditjirri TaxID=282569 RepID=A0A8H4SV76_9HYPO|nr:hypothetical protein FGADI_11414 [Fusarium gaditjirri]